MAIHMEYAIELPLICRPGDHAMLRAVLAEQGGWDVSVRREDDIVLQKHCADWHRHAWLW